MNLYYSKLCTEFYDVTKPEAGPKEVAFYEKLLKTAKGPILEAMCGSGRLLIPLLRRGLTINGLDNSMDMLKSCQRRVYDKNFSTKLYNQFLQNLDMSEKYDIVFIAIGSFQLIHENSDAVRALQNLSSILLPGGRLVIETFIPWDSIKENIKGSVLAAQSEEKIFEKSVDVRDGVRIVHRSAISIHFDKQLEKTRSRYEKWINDKISHYEEEEYIVRWYHRFEMQLLLEKIGFLTIDILDESFEQNEQAIIYVAHKADADITR